MAKNAHADILAGSHRTYSLKFQSEFTNSSYGPFSSKMHFQLIVRDLMDKWMQFCDGNREPILSDLKSHGYQSTLDLPMICFFDDIMKEFPDAKVLLTVRDSPKAWVKVN